MKTVYSKLAKLIALMIAGILLFAPMRFGNEDYLYARPRSIRMSPGDSYAISCRLDADDPRQSISYASTNDAVAAVDPDGTVTAVGTGRAQILLDAENGARAKVSIEVIGARVDTLALNTDSLEMEKGQVSGLKAIFNDEADNTRVRWTSANESVATVDAVGRVLAVGGGKTRVTAGHQRSRVGQRHAHHAGGHIRRRRHIHAPGHAVHSRRYHRRRLLLGQQRR